MRRIVSSIEVEFRRYKVLGEAAMGQLSMEEICAAREPGVNSVAVIAWHVGNNLKSRFTNFLTTDGEKAWRKRDEEFEGRTLTREALLEKWEDGWDMLFDTLDELTDRDLQRVVTIRGLELSVVEALLRSLAHASYHVGQIVHIAREYRREDWEFLSIPPGKSEEYNQNPTMEKG